MPTQNRDNEAKLKALREAAQVGIDDIEAGRYRTFETVDELDEYFRTRAEKIINSRRT